MKGLVGVVVLAACSGSGDGMTARVSWDADGCPPYVAVVEVSGPEGTLVQLANCASRGTEGLIPPGGRLTLPCPKSGDPDDDTVRVIFAPDRNGGTVREPRLPRMPWPPVERGADPPTPAGDAPVWSGRMEMRHGEQTTHTYVRAPIDEAAGTARLLLGCAATGLARPHPHLTIAAGPASSAAVVFDVRGWLLAQSVMPTGSSEVTAEVTSAAGQTVTVAVIGEAPADWALAPYLHAEAAPIAWAPVRASPDDPAVVFVDGRFDARYLRGSPPAAASSVVVMEIEHVPKGRCGPYGLHELDPSGQTVARLGLAVSVREIEARTGALRGSKMFRVGAPSCPRTLTYDTATGMHAIVAEMPWKAIDRWRESL